MSSVLSDAISKNLRKFSDAQGGPVELGEYLITRAIAEAAGLTAAPAAPEALPTPATLVAVDPVQGAEGRIALPEFVSPGPVPSEPTVGPAYHGARSLSLAAPLTNADAIYFSQFPTVIPPTGTFDDEAGDPYTESLLYPDFVDGTGNLPTAWVQTPGADLTWDKQPVGARLYAPATATDSGTIAQTVDIEAGNYNVTVDMSTVAMDLGGTFEISVQVDAVEVLNYTTDNWVDAASFSHIGGACTVAIVISVDGAAGNPVEATIGSVSVIRNDTPPTVPVPGQVGTPLYPGQTAILSRADYDLTRPLYVVPVIGETSERVIANYNY